MRKTWAAYLLLVIALCYFVGLPLAMSTALLQQVNLPLISEPWYPLSHLGGSTSMTNRSATYYGTLTIAKVTPLSCSENCSSTTIYFLTSSSPKQTLLLNFPDGFHLPGFAANGTRVMIGGTLVVPSSWTSIEYSPVYVFDGDIYVSVIAKQ